MIVLEEANVSQLQTGKGKTKIHSERQTLRKPDFMQVENRVSILEVFVTVLWIT